MKLINCIRNVGLCAALLAAGSAWADNSTLFTPPPASPDFTPAAPSFTINFPPAPGGQTLNIPQLGTDDGLGFGLSDALTSQEDVLEGLEMPFPSGPFPGFSGLYSQDPAFFDLGFAEDFYNPGDVSGSGSAAPLASRQGPLLEPVPEHGSSALLMVPALCALALLHRKFRDAKRA